MAVRIFCDRCDRQIEASDRVRVSLVYSDEKGAPNSAIYNISTDETGHYSEVCQRCADELRAWLRTAQPRPSKWVKAQPQAAIDADKAEQASKASPH